MENKEVPGTERSLEWNARKMTLLALVLLLALLPAEAVKSRHPPKASISSPMFGPRQVHGVLGGSVTVRCFYPPTPTNKHDRKYFCKMLGSICDTVVTTSFVKPQYQGKVSLTDHPDAESFQVNISALVPDDAGTYQCGIGVNSRGLSHQVILSVAEALPVPEPAELFYVKLRSTWTVSCSFGPETANWRRYLCKKEKDGCRNIADSHQNIDQDFTGRVLLTFEGSPGSFSVTMTQMDWGDTGLYYCGAGEYGKDGKSKELDVFVHEDKNFPQLKTTVIGKNGSSATFECLYEPLQRSSTRIWCKWRPQGCEKIIDNAGYVSPKYLGRVAMFENQANKTLTIVLNQLRPKDQGYYWCMSNELKEQQSSTELKVVEGEPSLKVENTVQAQVGSKVELTCSYPCKYYSFDKYWCKWNETGCPKVPAREQRPAGPEATCSTSNRTMVLSFDPVTEQDEGWYWCGVKRNGVFGESVAVELQVTTGSDAKHSPELLDVDASSESGAVPPGGAYNDAEVRKGAAPESSDESRGSNTLALVLGPLAGLILIAVTAFAIFKYRQLKRSDLVSVGSYRTNISMSDFESARDYSASNNGYSVRDSLETPAGGDEFITTSGTAESAVDAKKVKRSSREGADLVTSDSVTQDSPVGDVSPAQDQL